MATTKAVPTTQASAGVKRIHLDQVHTVQWRIAKAVHTLRKALDQYEGELHEAQTSLRAMAAAGRFGRVGFLVQETIDAKEGVRHYRRTLDRTLDAGAFSDVAQTD